MSPATLNTRRLYSVRWEVWLTGIWLFLKNLCHWAVLLNSLWFPKPHFRSNCRSSEGSLYTTVKKNYLYNERQKRQVLSKQIDESKCGKVFSCSSWSHLQSKWTAAPAATWHSWSLPTFTVSVVRLPYLLSLLYDHGPDCWSFLWLCGYTGQVFPPIRAVREDFVLILFFKIYFGGFLSVVFAKL